MIFKNIYNYYIIIVVVNVLLLIKASHIKQITSSMLCLGLPFIIHFVYNGYHATIIYVYVILMLLLFCS